jgi:hypothetical protein
MDELLVSQVGSVSGLVVQVEGNRLDWWRTRLRLRRRYGVVATRVDGAE